MKRGQRSRGTESIPSIPSIGAAATGDTVARGRRKRRRDLHRTALLALLLVALPTAAFAVSLVNGLGGARDYGENVLAANDDGSTGAIDIRPIFGPAGINFFGTSYTSLYVNNNGNLTFTTPLSTFTPFGITGGSTPIIAAWFADVDTRGAHAPANANLVYYDLDTVNGVFSATWDLVGYYSQQADKLNDFQIRLVSTGGGDFVMEFRYRQLQWTTGSASGGSGGLGGTPARAGYSAGNGSNFFELPSSGNQAQMLDLINQSNVGTPGLFTFAVTNGQPQICGDGVIAGFEQCDDHNHVSGDGCSGTCAVESCYTCTGEPSVCTPQASGTGCASDGNPCTLDQCNGSGSCSHPAGNAGTECRAATGECDAAELCDGSAANCPADAQQLAGAPCGNPAATDCSAADSCDGNGNCVAADQPEGAPCGDATSDTCTAPDTCDGAGTCLANDTSAGVACADDGEICSVDECDGSGACAHTAGNGGTLCRAAVGQCDAAEACDGALPQCPPDTYAPYGSPCGSGAVTSCSGGDICDGSNTCTSNDYAAGTPCSDGDACTGSDLCDGAGTCDSGPAVVCGACELCDTIGGCTPVIQLACDAPVPGKSVLSVRNRGDNTRDRIVYKQKLAASTQKSDFGDPRAGGTTYELCLYDDKASPGMPETLAYSVAVPSGPAWRENGAGFSLALPGDDPALTVRLRAGAAGKGKVLVRAKGASLNLTPHNAGVFFSQSDDVTAVLVARDSRRCFRSVFPRPWKANLPNVYKDKD